MPSLTAGPSLINQRFSQPNRRNDGLEQIATENISVMINNFPGIWWLPKSDVFYVNVTIGCANLDFMGAAVDLGFATEHLTWCTLS